MSAIHRHEGHEVAVKFIIKSKIPEHSWAYDDDGNRIPLEAKMLSLVNHPGIIKFIDLFEDEVYFYLVEELHGTPWSAGVKFSKLPDSATMPSRSSSSNTSVSDVLADNIYRASQYSTRKPEDSSLGLHLREEHSDGVDHRTPSKPEFVRRPSRDLFECIEQSEYKRLSEADARYIFAQVVDIVDYLDDEGITHRDVKDENLVIDENLKVKLIDFGSVVITDPTQPRPYYDLFYGTAAYASSEILRKMPYQAPPAEIWTLGVLLSYLLTGSSPFPSETHALEGKVKLDEQCGARVSRSCLHLMKRCLDADPERRADIKEVKAHPWLKGALARRC
ncbi:kinase-like protein [Rickenella mellea]|uniref:Kinase-like protein n=1 Tax=Rickenella mellea TaxID=50990 RepID=A0A4Y7QAL7_9AGAM|nr:kinase-like protein [Rickenella mellea]